MHRLRHSACDVCVCVCVCVMLVCVTDWLRRYMSFSHAFYAVCVHAACCMHAVCHGMLRRKGGWLRHGHAIMGIQRRHRACICTCSMHSHTCTWHQHCNCKGCGTPVYAPLHSTHVCVTWDAHAYDASVATLQCGYICLSPRTTVPLRPPIVTHPIMYCHVY